MHEAALGPRQLHQLPGDPVGRQIMDALCPDGIGLTHGYPDIRIQDIRAADSLPGIFDEGEFRPGLPGDFHAFLPQGGVRMVFGRRAGDETHAHLRAAHHQGIAHVVPGVPQINQLPSPQRAEMLPDGQEIRQDLGGMKLIGQTVPDRDAGITGQILDDLLAVAPVFNAVKHPAQHPGRIRDGFLFADLAPGGIQIGHLHPQIMRSHLKGAAGPGGGLFKNQGDVFSRKEPVGNAVFFLFLQIRGQIQEPFDFSRGQIQQLQKMPVFQMEHVPFLHKKDNLL